MQSGKVGDHLIVESEHVGERPREGEIVEVRGAAETTHYVVRWQDGRQTTVFPGIGTTVVHRPRKRAIA